MQRILPRLHWFYILSSFLFGGKWICALNQGKGNTPANFIPYKTFPFPSLDAPANFIPYKTFKRLNFERMGLGGCYTRVGPIQIVNPEKVIECAQPRVRNASAIYILLSFFHSFFHSFILSFFHSFFHSFIHSFFHSFVGFSAKFIRVSQF